MLFYGEKVHVIGYGENKDNEGWYKIDFNGSVGYIRADLLQEDAVEIPKEPEPAPKPEPDSSKDGDKEGKDDSDQHSGTAKGEAVASLAESFEGTPYEFGGATPEAFDCSGFVMYCYSKFGVDLPHNAAYQAEVGIDVPFSRGDYSNLAPGDILTFADSRGVYHSGIYVGNNTMIHASDWDTGVIYSRIDSDHYMNVLYKVRRIFY